MISQNRLYNLALLQLEQYDTRRYLDKVEKVINPDLIKRLKWTLRLRVTLYLSYIFGVTNANILLSIPHLVVEQVVSNWVEQRILMLKQNGLKVVAITGSYGKTSVKYNVYELLRHKYRVVATPESYNTIFGIAKCLAWEVDEKTEIFIVEVGAYHIGDITRLLKMVLPDYGILTGVARQHLERFGTFENIKKAKGEIVEYMNWVGGILFANGADSNVREIVEKIGSPVHWYSGDGRLRINLAGAKLVAQTLGLSKKEIEAIRVRGVKNRFEMTTQRYGMSVIDDSFSSNDIGFADAISYLGKQKKYTRILVTPGIVELGEESEQIHTELGKKIVGNADLVILVGKNERTQSLAKGIGNNMKILWIDKTLQFIKVVNDLKLKKEPLVLLENDVTENYN